MWLIFAILAAILWGLNYSLTEKILYSISPITLLALEMACGAVFFSLLSYFTTLKKDLVVLTNTPLILWLTAVEIVVLMLASYFIVSSIHLKNATIAGILELIYPLFTIFFTWFLFSQIDVNASVIVGGILIFIGVLIISLA